MATSPNRIKKQKTPSQSTKFAPYESDLEYLEEEMTWISVRVDRVKLERKLHELATSLARPRDPDDDFFPSHSTSTMREKLETLEELLDRARKEDKERRRKVDRRLATHRGSKTAFQLGLDKLCESLALTPFERQVLLLAAAPCFSSDLSNRVDELATNGHQLIVESIFNFESLGFAERIRHRRFFTPTSSLLSQDLITLDFGRRYADIEDLLSGAVSISKRVFDVMLGDDALGDAFEDFSSLEAPRGSFDQLVLPEADLKRILSVVERHDEYLEARQAWGFDEIIRYGRGLLMLFHGKPGTGKTLAAHAIADKLGKRVFNVDIPAFVQHADAGRFLPSLFREARVQNALLFFDECESLFGDRRGGNDLMTLLLTELERFEGVAVMATNLPDMLDEALARRILVRVHFKEPDRQARREIWRRHLPASAPVAADVDLDILADRFDMTGGYIKNAVLGAVARAVHSGGITSELQMSHFEQAADDQVQRTSNDDHRLTESKVRFEDVVLPSPVKAMVRELVDAARDRRTVLERWGIGEKLTYGKGLAALFVGGPGTGKSLCAEVIAGELNRPLLNVAIPSIVSKWVGETERNLAAVFEMAKAQRAVCFLDEADALLGQRQDHESRHDISAVTVLLKALEGFDGVALLATNRPTALDAALNRRVSYRVEFPFPGPVERAEIWRRLLPETVPFDGEANLESLGEAFALNGGEIKNAVFKAAFRAAREGVMTQELLVRAAAEELTACGRVERSIGFKVA